MQKTAPQIIWSRALRAVAAFVASSTLLCANASAQDVVFVHIAPSVGPAAQDARDIATGLSAGLKASRGARKVSLVALDDRSDPDEFLRQADAAMKRRPVAIVAPIGPQVVERLLTSGWLDRNDVLVVNPVSSGDAFRSPGHPRLLHLRASDTHQIEKIVSHVDSIGNRSMLVLTPKDVPNVGEPFSVTLKAANRGRRLRLVQMEVPIEPKALALEAERAPHADAVLALGPPPFMAQAIAAFRNARPAMRAYALSHLTVEALAATAGDASRGVSIAQVFPDPRGSSRPLQGEFRAAMLKQDKNISVPNAFHMEGYLVSRTLTEALKRSASAKPADVLTALRTMGPVDLGGYNIDFSKGNEGSRFVELGVVTNGARLRY